MKWENLINLKKGYEIGYLHFCGANSKKALFGSIVDIDVCRHLSYGICDRYRENKKCIGRVLIKELYWNEPIIKCGVEDGWSLIDPEDFITEEEFKL